MFCQLTCSQQTCKHAHITNDSDQSLACDQIFAYDTISDKFFDAVAILSFLISAYIRVHIARIGGRSLTVAKLLHWVFHFQRPRILLRMQNLLMPLTIA